MKKILSAIIMTALIGLGLVAVTSSPASAACPYTACVATTTFVKTPAVKKAGKSIPVKINVTAPGNVEPRGTVSVGIVKNGHGVFLTTVPYVGGRVTVVTQTLKKGTYTVFVRFNPDPASVFLGSTATTSFVIIKSRHRN